MKQVLQLPGVDRKYYPPVTSLVVKQPIMLTLLRITSAGLVTTNTRRCYHVHFQVALQPAFKLVMSLCAVCLLQ